MRPDSKVHDDWDAQDSDENDDEYEYRAGHKPHTCTDCPCLILFIAALGFLVRVWIYAEKHGDRRRLFHGYDYRGRLCGVDTDDDNTTLGEYLYWCPTTTLDLSAVASLDEALTGTDDGNASTNGVVAAAASTNLAGMIDFAHPICKDACPDGLNGSMTSCVQMPPEKGPVVPLGDAAGSFEQTFIYNFKLMPDYPSQTFAHRYCMPKNPALMKVLKEAIAGDWAAKALEQAGEILYAWVPLVITALIAFVCGYLFLIIIRYLAWCLVVSCIAILTVGAYVGAGFFIAAVYSEDVTATSNQQWDWIIAVCLLVVGVFFTVISCCAWTSIRTAIGCVEAACECMFSMPTLLLEPLINLTFKMGMFAVLLFGFVTLLSCGKVRQVSLQEYAALPASDVSGVLRSFEHTREEQYFLLYFLFMIFWIMKLMTALGQFVISYAVQLWYFTPYVEGDKDDLPCCGIMGGYCKGIFFHLGSLAFGSLIVALLMIVRVILGTIQKQAQAAGGDNAVVGCCVKICQCCLWCFQRFIEFLNKNAYMDIAITSSNFCVAAKRAMMVIMQNVAAVAFLNGATWIIEWLGMGAITSGSAYIAYLMVKNIGEFSDSTSEHYVESPATFAVIAGIVAIMIAKAFMTVFDTTADCILYCFAVETERRKKGEFGAGERFCPPTLDALVQDAAQGQF